MSHTDYDRAISPQEQLQEVSLILMEALFRIRRDGVPLVPRPPAPPARPTFSPPLPLMRQRISALALVPLKCCGRFWRLIYLFNGKEKEARPGGEMGAVLAVP